MGSRGAGRFAWCARILVIPVVLGVGACAADPPMTPVEYRRAAQAICRETTRETPPPSPTDESGRLRAAARRSVARQREALARLQSLDAPASVEPGVGRWLDVVRRTLATADDSLDAQERGNLKAAGVANAQGSLLSGRADELARDLGLTDCVANTS